MRRHGLVLLCTLGLAALAAAVAATVAGARSTPAIRAAQAHERAVIAQVDAIGRDLQLAEDAAQNAQNRLALVKASLQRNEYRLHVAKANLRAAQQRLMARLYSLYVNGAPTTIDVIAGAHSLSEMIQRAESAQVLSNQDAALGRQALSFEHSVQARERQLKRLQAQRAQALRQKEARKREVASALGRQKRLLASIHTTISQLQAQEAARERAARAAAAARLRAEIAARQKAAREAAAQAQQSQQSSSAPTIVAPPPVSVPTGGTGAGHSAAASIALHYLGIPYVYGGASPSGFDCSGLVMYVYAQLGISLPHYTVAQWNATQPISSPAPGDLVFFNGLGHVGIYIGGGRFVSAPHTGSVVRIDSMSGFGSYDGARRVP
ncbi:MAG TPA: NlpC/P60 family protein [Gaiellaceae bacterium]|jgi:cell wall-associated NlpC family hydrolase|nr:NlpC/P60 family protein [Gaiellaceae bacterium]